MGQIRKADSLIRKTSSTSEPVYLVARPVRRESHPPSLTNEVYKDKAEYREPVETRHTVDHRITIEFPDWLSVVVLPVTISLTCVVLLSLYFVTLRSPEVYVVPESQYPVQPPYP